jgi:hypothetical protein
MPHQNTIFFYFFKKKKKASKNSLSNKILAMLPLPTLDLVLRWRGKEGI